MNQIAKQTVAPRPYLPISCSPAQAGSVLAELDMRTVDATRITAWLQPVIRAVSNPPSPQELAERVRAMVLACQDLPAWAFDRDTAAEAVRKFKFWPAAAEVYELVRGAVADDLGRVANLRAIAATAKPDASERVPPTAEEVRNVAAKLRRLCAELATQAEREKPLVPLRQAPQLSRATLNEIYRREGLVAPSVPTDAR